MSAIEFIYTDNVSSEDAGHLNNTDMTSSNGTDLSSALDFLFIWNHIFVPSLFGLITLIGAIGNSMVIYIILSKNKMRTLINLLLLNLAIADISFVLICPPFTAYVLAYEDWPFGDVACKLMHYLLNVTAYVTVYTLVLISAIRYMTIVHSQRTNRIRTKRNIVIMIVAIWVLMLVLNVPIIQMHGTTNSTAGGFECDNSSWEVGKEIFSTFFAFAYVLPLVVICIQSVLILRYIKKQKPSTLSKKNKSQDKKRQASKLIISVVVIFALLWLPVQIHLLVAYVYKIPGSDVYKSISVLFNCLAYFNSCVNPIIYNFSSRDFREEFRNVAMCRKRSPEKKSTKHVAQKKKATPDSSAEKHLLSPIENAGHENSHSNVNETNIIRLTPDMEKHSVSQDAYCDNSLGVTEPYQNT